MELIIVILESERDKTEAKIILNSANQKLSPNAKRKLDAGDVECMYLYFELLDIWTSPSNASVELVKGTYKPLSVVELYNMLNKEECKTE